MSHCPHIGTLASLAVSLTLFLDMGCSRRPEASPELRQPRMLHAQVAGQRCPVCHRAAEAPAPINGYPHGGGQDCSVCHAPKDDHSGWLPRRAFDHSGRVSACLPCHIVELPPKPHPQNGGDCRACHRFPDFYPPTDNIPTAAGAAARAAAADAPAVSDP